MVVASVVGEIVGARLPEAVHGGAAVEVVGDLRLAEQLLDVAGQFVLAGAVGRAPHLEAELPLDGLPALVVLRVEVREEPFVRRVGLPPGEDFRDLRDDWQLERVRTAPLRLRRDVQKPVFAPEVLPFQGAQGADPHAVPPGKGHGVVQVVEQAGGEDVGAPARASARPLVRLGEDRRPEPARLVEQEPPGLVGRVPLLHPRLHADVPGVGLRGEDGFPDGTEDVLVPRSRRFLGGHLDDVHPAQVGGDVAGVSDLAPMRGGRPLLSPFHKPAEHLPVIVQCRVGCIEGIVLIAFPDILDADFWKAGGVAEGRRPGKAAAGSAASPSGWRVRPLVQFQGDGLIVCHG